MAEKPHNFRIDDKTWIEFRKLCLDRGKSAKEVIVNFIKNEVEKYKKKERKR